MEVVPLRLRFNRYSASSSRAYAYCLSLSFLMSLSSLLVLLSFLFFDWRRTENCSKIFGYQNFHLLISSCLIHLWSARNLFFIVSGVIDLNAGAIGDLSLKRNLIERVSRVWLWLMQLCCWCSFLAEHRDEEGGHGAEEGHHRIGAVWSAVAEISVAITAFQSCTGYFSAFCLGGGLAA